MKGANLRVEVVEDVEGAEVEVDAEVVGDVADHAVAEIAAAGAVEGDGHGFGEWLGGELAQQCEVVAAGRVGGERFFSDQFC